MLSNGSTVVDVGANIGMFSLFAAQEWPMCPIVAVEPVADLVHVCRLNLGGRALQLVEAACLEAPGPVELTYYPHYSILSGRHASPEADLRAALATLRAAGQVADDIDDEELVELLEVKLRGAIRIEVPGRTLDSIVEETVGRAPLGLVKVDVEGDEIAVIAGGRRSLLRAQNVVVEVSGSARVRETARALEAFGLVVENYQSAGYAGSELELLWGRRIPD